MKILYEDRISSVSASSTFGTFVADNVLTDRPRQPWIGTLADSDLVETFTANVSGSASYPIQGFFIAGLIADSATWVLKDSGSTTINSGTLNTAIPLTSDLAGNASNANQYFKNQAYLLRSEFIVFDTPMEDSGTLVITLTTSVNRIAQNIKGNAIDAWEAVADTTTGRLVDSADVAINILDHGLIQLGGFFQGTELAGPVATNTTISVDTLAKTILTVNDTITLTIDDDVILTITEGDTGSQFDSITGDGTAVNGVSMADNIGSVSATAIYFSLRIGTLRCGTLLDLPNPTGVSVQNFDYSQKRPHMSGGYSHQQRGVGNKINIKLILTNTQQQSLMDVHRAFRAKPIPVLWVQGMPSAFNEGERASGLYYISANPSSNFIGNQGGISVTALSLNEIL